MRIIHMQFALCTPMLGAQLDNALPGQRRWACYPVEVVYGAALLEQLVFLANNELVGLGVDGHHLPGAAVWQAQTAALANGVAPNTVVNTQLFASCADNIAY